MLALTSSLPAFSSWQNTHPTWEGECLPAPQPLSLSEHLSSESHSQPEHAPRANQVLLWSAFLCFSKSSTSQTAVASSYWVSQRKEQLWRCQAGLQVVSNATCLVTQIFWFLLCNLWTFSLYFLSRICIQIPFLSQLTQLTSTLSRLSTSPTTHRRSTRCSSHRGCPAGQWSYCKCLLAVALMGSLVLPLTPGSPGVFHHVLCASRADFSLGEVSPSLHPERQRIHPALSRLCGDEWGSQRCCGGRLAQQVDERPIKIVSSKANYSKICHFADLWMLWPSAKPFLLTLNRKFSFIFHLTF